MHRFLHASATNPFATHRVRAGALSYLFADDSLPRFAQHLQATHGNGQIVGPHGSGKSTLLATLDPIWNDLGKTAITFSLHNGQRKLPVLQNFRWQTCNSASQIIVDGAEQLSTLRLWSLRLFCHWRRCGMLITTHRPLRVCLPVVETTSIDFKRFAELVDQLGATSLGHERMKSCLRRTGNVREAFMMLYDIHERESYPAGH